MKKQLKNINRYKGESPVISTCPALKTFNPKDRIHECGSNQIRTNALTCYDTMLSLVTTLFFQKQQLRVVFLDQLHIRVSHTSSIREKFMEIVAFTILCSQYCHTANHDIFLNTLAMNTEDLFFTMLENSDRIFPWAPLDYIRLQAEQ